MFVLSLLAALGRIRDNDGDIRHFPSTARGCCLWEKVVGRRAGHARLGAHPPFFLHFMTASLFAILLSKAFPKCLAHRLGPTSTSSPQSGQAAKEVVVFPTILRRQGQHLGCSHSSVSAQSGCLRMDLSRWYYIPPDVPKTLQLSLHRICPPRSILLALPEFLPVETEQNFQVCSPVGFPQHKVSKKSIREPGLCQVQAEKKTDPHRVKRTLSLNPRRDSKVCRIPRRVSGKAALGI